MTTSYDTPTLDARDVAKVLGLSESDYRVRAVADHPYEFSFGISEALSAAGMTYDDDPESPRSVAYDMGRNVGDLLAAFRSIRDAVMPTLMRVGWTPLPEATETAPWPPPEEPAPGRFRKRPVEVDARRWDGPDNGGVDRLAEWAGLRFFAFGNTADARGYIGPADKPWDAPEWPLWVWCEASQALVTIRVGDWLIREADGSGVYPCRAADFASAYEPAS